LKNKKCDGFRKDLSLLPLRVEDAAGRQSMLVSSWKRFDFDWDALASPAEYTDCDGQRG